VDVAPNTDTVGSLRELLARRQKLSRKDFHLCTDGQVLDESEDSKLLKTVVNLAYPELTVTMKTAYSQPLAHKTSLT
jgi:hypothetical protein